MTKGGTAGPAVRMWARSELGRRWRALVALGVIAGVAAGLALAAVAGARRTSTAYDRWRKATAAPDAIVFGTQVIQDPEQILHIDYSPVTKLPEVVDAGEFTLAPVGAPKLESSGLQPGDTHLYRTLARPLLRAGRLPNPARADEMVVNLPAAKKYHLHVGQRVTVVSSTDPNAWQSGVPSGGPTVEATIVGIGDSMLDVIFSSNDPGFEMSGAYLATYPDIPHPPNLVVRLKPGTDVNAFHERAVAAMRSAAAPGVEIPDIPVRDMREDAKRLTHGTELERTALWLFALAVILAGLVLVGQALSRTVYTMAESTPALRALGFTRPNIVSGLLLPIVVTAVIAAAIAVGAALLLSSRFPVGLARTLDPDTGTHADWTVLLLGATGVIVVVLAGAAFAGWRAAVAAEQTPTSPPTSRLGRALRTTLPLPAAIGAGLALQGGRGERAVPVRPALAGAVAGVLGIVGVLGLVHGIDDALARPSRAGQVWDAEIDVSDPQAVPAISDQLRGDRQVATAAELQRLPLKVNGAGIPIYALNPVKGDLNFVVLRGRAPKAPDEIAVGPSSLKSLQRGVGSRVQVESSNGQSSTFKIVGTTLLLQTPHSSFDQGAWVPPAAYEKLVDRAQEGNEHGVLATARSGIKPIPFVHHLQSELGDSVGEVGPAGLPQDVIYLRNVRNLPRALAAFLAVLGIAAVGHALLMTVRRRRHDLAVLRAIGLRPRQSAACIFWQAMTVAVIALAIGIPLGIILGRLSWRWVADSTPLLYVPPLAALAIAIAIPAAIVLANLLAAYPARRAAGVRPAEVLRTE